MGMVWVGIFYSQIANTMWKELQIEATYVTETGETKSSLLLCSGWYISQLLCMITVFALYFANLKFLCRWGMSRHFHYVWEILAAFFWSVPALFSHVQI